MEFETRILQLRNPVRTSLQSFFFPHPPSLYMLFCFCLLICARLISTYNLIINTRNHSDLIQQKTWFLTNQALYKVAEQYQAASAVTAGPRIRWHCRCSGSFRVVLVETWLEHVSDLARSILVQSIEMFCSHQPIVVNGSKTWDKGLR